MLEKTQKVLHHKYLLDITGSVCFVDSAEEHSFIIGQDEWNDMGSPLTITLTIEPGDKLNV